MPFSRLNREGTTNLPGRLGAITSNATGESLFGFVSMGINS